MVDLSPIVIFTLDPSLPGAGMTITEITTSSPTLASFAFTVKVELSLTLANCCVASQPK